MRLPSEAAVSTVMQTLPTEIYIRILGELPLTEAGVRALARCSVTGNNPLRTASLEPSLWKLHYGHRYVHSDGTREAERRARLQENWREMYRERRLQDREALDALSALEVCEPSARIEYARRIVALHLDIWDTLSEVAHRPPPPLFHRDEDIQAVSRGSPLANLTTKYWAHVLLKIIPKRLAIDRWLALKKFLSGEAADPPSFEEAYANLSSFYEVLPDTIFNLLDAEAENCRTYLERVGTEHDPESQSFNTRALCNDVCAYLRSRGSGKADQMDFYRYRNSFPHCFLTTERRTLPMSLVFIFVAIMKRLGLDACPVDTPNCVTAYVRNIHVNVSSDSSNTVIGQAKSYNMVKHIFDPDFQAKFTALLLGRAARNIIMALTLELIPTANGIDFNSFDVSTSEPARYLSKILLALLQSAPADNDEGWLTLYVFKQRTLFMLDFELLIQDKLSQYFPTTSGLSVENNDNESDALGSPALSTRDDLFVGQIVTAEGPYFRCITGYKEKEGQIKCSTLAHCHHYVELFPIDCTEPAMISAEIFKTFLKNPTIGLFFKDAEFHEAGVGNEKGYGRFIMNDRLMKLYPGEDERGARWLREA